MTVRFSATALGEIDAILTHIRDRSPRGAARVEARIARAVRMIDGNPFAGAPTDRAGIRRVVLTPHPYAMLYRVTGAGALVIDVRHTARRA